MDVYKSLKQLGACEEEAQKFKGLSVRKAWKVADRYNIVWVLDHLCDPELLDYLWQHKIAYDTTADDLREMLPVPTDADLRTAICAYNRVEEAYDAFKQSYDFDAYWPIRNRAVKSRPWVLNPKAVAA